VVKSICSFWSIGYQPSTAINCSRSCENQVQFHWYTCAASDMTTAEPSAISCHRGSDALSQARPPSSVSSNEISRSADGFFNSGGTVGGAKVSKPPSRVNAIRPFSANSTRCATPSHRLSPEETSRSERVARDHRHRALAAGTLRVRRSPPPSSVANVAIQHSLAKHDLHFTLDLEQFLASGCSPH
jgi:hypothetical protein